MTGWNEAFPFACSRSRLEKASAEAIWYDVCDWCDQTFGSGEWEYFNNEYRFKTESALMLFTLKWLT